MVGHWLRQTQQQPQLQRETYQGRCLKMQLIDPSGMQTQVLPVDA